MAVEKFAVPGHLRGALSEPRFDADPLGDSRQALGPCCIQLDRESARSGCISLKGRVNEAQQVLGCGKTVRTVMCGPFEQLLLAEDTHREVCWQLHAVALCA